MTSSADDELASRLITLAARLTRAVRHQREYPAAGARVLSILDEHGPLKVTDLAALDQCSQPTMTGTVKGLVERGYVARLPHPDDARATLVAPTPDGRAALARLRVDLGRVVTGWLPEGSSDDPDTTGRLAATVEFLEDLLAHDAAARVRRDPEGDA